MGCVKLTHINKTFDKGVVAVSDFDLEVESGEFVVIVGTSGCGKSTVLRMIAGLEQPSAGELFIGGKDMDGVPPGERDIAMVFQDYTLYPNLTVRDNLAFGLKLRKYDREEVDRRVLAAATSLNILPLLSRLPKDLSGGEKQRVALGRVLVRRPKVFLLDEPLSGVDAKFKAQMRAEISRLHKESGTTFIYVTHDQTEAMTMGDRIVLMDGGRIVQIDTPAVLYDYPTNSFAATFIGMPQMNMIPSTVDGREVNLGVRPEDIVIGDSGTECSLVSLEQLGDETILYLDAGYPHNIIAKTAADFTLKAGQKMKFSYDEKKVKLFDRMTGESLSGMMPKYNKFPYAHGGEIFGRKLPPELEKSVVGKPDGVGVRPDGFVRGEGEICELIDVQEYPNVCVCRLKIGDVVFTAKLPRGDDLIRGKKISLTVRDGEAVLLGGGERVSAKRLRGEYTRVTFAEYKHKGVITDIEIVGGEILVEIECKKQTITAIATDLIAHLYVGSRVRFDFCQKI